MGRIQKSLRNIIYNLISTFLSMLLLFVVRTYFIRTLGSDYLGLNGLMTNIISMLSLAELGIGTALIFKLYEPLSKNDYHYINRIMVFYKYAYRIISLVIFLSGLIILPFLNFLIKGDTSFVSIYFVFFVFLIQSVSTYLFFAYKSSLLIADQKEYLIVRYSLVVDFISSFAQIFFLINIASYYIYLLIVILGTIFKNVLISLRVNREYVEINFSSKDNLPKNEIISLAQDVKAIFLYKISNLVIKSTDNLIISSFLGLSKVGLYSNYVLITSSLQKIVNPIFQSIKASLGNFYAEKGKKDTYRLFKIVNMLTAIIYGGSSIGIFVLSNAFLSLWIGNQFIISFLFPLIIAIEFYLRGMQYFLSHFRNIMGLFQQAKYRPVIGMIINLIASLYFVVHIGIEGVLLGTILSSLLTYMWYDPLVIHRDGFNRSVKGFYITNLYYLLIISLAGTISYFTFQKVYQGTLISLFLVLVILFFIIIFIFIAGLSLLNEFKTLIEYIKIITSNIFNKSKKRGVL